jgi:hypothetical protein
MARNLSYGAGAKAYFDKLKKWCADGKLADMEVRYEKEMPKL